METEVRYYWTYMHPAWGRVMTKSPLSEASALEMLPDAVKVEGTEVLGPAPRLVGWGASEMPLADSDGNR